MSCTRRLAVAGPSRDAVQAEAPARIHRNLVRRTAAALPAALCLLAVAAPASPAFTSQLRRYPYLTDAVAGGVTVNWGTDQSLTAGSVRWGLAGAEACTAHTVTATRTSVNVNGVLEYQWRARIALPPDTTFCYRVFGGAVDLLGSDASPQATTQVTPGSAAPFSFAVLGDWGQGLAAGNPKQAGVMRQIAASGARFVLSTGDIGYPSGNQANYGDLVQTGDNVSGVFGPGFWTVVGNAKPMFTPVGNHGFNATFLSMWPSGTAASSSGGTFGMETYCCKNGTTSASLPSAWYAFDQGNTRFYVLEAAWADTNLGTATDYKNDFDNHWTPTSPEYQWLQRDLESHPSQLKFAVWHYPLYSDNATEVSDTFLRGANSLEGLLNRYGVDLGFNGHAHIYQRNAAAPGGLVTYITGGGGASIEPANRCSAIDAYAVGWNNALAQGSACGAATPPASASQVFHYLLVTVDGRHVTVTPTDSTGRTFDVQSYDFPDESAPPPAPPAPPGPPVATAASRTRTTLTASFRRAPAKRTGRRTKTKRTKRTGHRSKATRKRIVDGRLSAVPRQPLAGEAVQMQVRPRMTGSRWKTVRTGRTTATGHVSFRVAPSPSLYVRLVFRRTTTLGDARSPRLETRVARWSSIAVSAGTRATGQTLTFHGRLRGGYVTKRGRAIELQRFDSKIRRWRRVRRTRVRTDRAGRWHVRVSGTTAGAGSSKVRLRIPARRDSPFDQGFSRTVTVTLFRR
jgi:hypothetical protein